MMTRKDYIKTSQIISDHSDLINENILYSIAKDFANYFANDNPRFDSKRFFAACGINK